MSRGDCGSASVELALTLPAVVLVLAGCLAAVQAAGVGTALPAAALAGARAAAVAGDDAAVAEATRVAGAAARVSVARADGWVRVEVALDLGFPWGDRVAAAAQPVEP